MRRKWLISFVIFILLSGMSSSWQHVYALDEASSMLDGSHVSDDASPTFDEGSLAGIPMPFYKNEGQISGGNVSYYADTFAGRVFVNEEGLTYALMAGQDGQQVWALNESFVGSEPLQVQGSRETDTNVQVFKGNNPDSWTKSAYSYESVNLGEVFEQINVTLMAHGNNIEKIFTVAPGGNPSNIAVKVQGQKSLAVDEDGRLIISTSLGDVKLTAPVAYQEIDGDRIGIPVAYQIQGDTYSFSVGQYNRDYPLTIDPLLASSYLGGTGIDQGGGLTVSPDGTVYVTGSTMSTDFPTRLGLKQDNSGNYDIFIARLSSDLTRMLTATYLGGYLIDRSASIELLDGDVYIAGYTTSPDIPHTKGDFVGSNDLYVARLNGGLNELKQAVIIGGSGSDQINAMTKVICDGKTELLIGGTTASYNLGTPGTLQSTKLQSGNAGFLAKLDTDLNTTEFTYLGGTAGASYVLAIEALPDGRIAAGGNLTRGTGFPSTEGAYDMEVSGTSATDGFVTILDNGLTQVYASTFIGQNSTTDSSIMNSSESIYALKYYKSTDGNGYIYAAGSGRAYSFSAGDISSGVPTTGSGSDAFVIKLTEDKLAKTSLAIFGGSASESPLALELDQNGNVFISGTSNSTDLPVTEGQIGYNGNTTEGFIAKYDQGLNLKLSSYTITRFYSLTMDEQRGLYAYGYTTRTDFPISSRGFQIQNSASADTIIARLDPATLFAASADQNPPSWSGQEIDFKDLTPDTLTLLWSAAVDESAIDEYLIYTRNLSDPDSDYVVTGSALGTMTGYSVTGLIPGNSYSFRIEAMDSAGNWTTEPLESGTVEMPISTAPDWPDGSSLSASYTDSFERIKLSWNAANDDGEVNGYKILKNGIEVTNAVYGYSVGESVYSTEITGLTASTPYTFKVEATDNDGYWSSNGPSVTVTTDKAPDILAPMWPNSSSRTDQIFTSLQEAILTWPSAQDNVGIDHYKIKMTSENDPSFSYSTEVDGSQSSCPVTVRNAERFYYSVTAYDEAGNASTALTSNFVIPTAPYGSGGGNGSGGGGGSAPNVFVVGTMLSSVYNQYDSKTETNVQISTFGLPVKDAVGVPLKPLIKVFFYYNVAGKVETNKQNFKLYEVQNDELVPVPVEVKALSNFDERRYLFVSPTQTLKPNTKYKLFIGKDIAANNSLAMNYNKELYFTTASINVANEVNVQDDGSAYIAIGSETPDGTVVTIPSGAADSALDLSPLVDHSGQEPVARNLPEIDLRATVADLNAGSPVLVTLPSGISLTGEVGWNGQFLAPIAIDPADTGVVLPSDAADYAVIHSVVEIGSREVPLTADRAVRVVFPGQKGFKVGYFRDGVFTKIDHQMSSDSQSEGDALPDGGDGVITVGSDLVVWTKHFTQFVLYGDASSTPSIAPTWNAGSLTASGVHTTGVTLTWSGAVDDSGVAEYRVYQNGELLTTTTVTEATYTVSGLSPATTYFFKVEAVDAEGLESNDGPTVNVTTLGDSSNEGGGTGTGNGDGSGTGTGSSGGGGGSTGGSVSVVTNATNTDGVFTADSTWLEAALKNTASAQLIIDLNGTTAKNGVKTAVIAADIAVKIKAAGKPLMLRDSGLEWIIPASSLPDGQVIKLNVSYPDLQSVSAAPAGTVGKAGYSLSVTADGKEIKNVGTGAVIRFPIPAGTADAELLGVYVPDSSGSGWTYAGGREGNGKLELKTGGTGVFLVVQSTLTFPDIASHWAKHDIEVMASRHIVKGVSDTQFAPNTTITRAEFAALLARTLQLETTAGTASFTDVAASSWYAGDVAKAAAAGLIKGDSGKFRPNDTITRQEMAVMIERAAKLKGAASTESGSLAFSDVTSIQAWAKEAVENVYALGIIKGRPDGSFGPAETATRAEAASMLLKLMNLLKL